MAITEDNVRVIVQDYMEDKVVFRDNCIDRHEALERSRDERGKEIIRLNDSVVSLTDCINGKFNRIYLSIIGTLATTVITLFAVILSWLLKK